MKEKRIKESSVSISHIATPQDANPVGNVHGGVIMKHIDDTAGLVATRHSMCIVVTASIDRLDFHNPAFIGTHLTFNGSINLVGATSMEIGVRVEAEDMTTGKRRHIASAYLTFVALDQNMKPTKVPPLIFGTEEERRRNLEAQARRKARLSERKKEKECQLDFDSCDL